MLCWIFLNADVASPTTQKKPESLLQQYSHNCHAHSPSLCCLGPLLKQPLTFFALSQRARFFLHPLQPFLPVVAGNFFDTDLKIWHSLDFLKSPLPKITSVMLSIQEADVDLPLFSAVNYISLYSFRVLDWREISEISLLSKSVKTNTCWPDQLLHCKTIKAIYSHLHIIMITAHCWIITSISSRSISSKVPVAALSPAKLPPREPQRFFSL